MLQFWRALLLVTSRAAAPPPRWQRIHWITKKRNNKNITNAIQQNFHQTGANTKIQLERNIMETRPQKNHHGVHLQVRPEVVVMSRFWRPLLLVTSRAAAPPPRWQRIHSINSVAQSQTVRLQVAAVLSARIALHRWIKRKRNSNKNIKIKLEHSSEGVHMYVLNSSFFWDYLPWYLLLLIYYILYV